MGSSSAHTTMPSPSSGFISLCTYGEIPRRELIPVLNICTTERAPDSLPPLSALMGVEQPLKKACRRQTLPMCLAIDPVAQSFGDSDRGAHEASTQDGNGPQRSPATPVPRGIGGISSASNGTATGRPAQFRA